MTTILGELAGSTALLSDPNGTNTGPILNSLLADDSIDVAPDVAAANDPAPMLSNAPLDSVTSLLDQNPFDIIQSQSALRSVS